MRINPRDLAESIAHFDAQLVPVASSEAKEPHGGFPIALPMITKAAREIVELVSEIAHNLTIPAFGEARQLGDEAADTAKKFPLRWRESRSRRIRIFWDQDRIFGDCSTYLVQNHGLDGEHERIAVLHSGEDPLKKLETWCQFIQCAGGRMTASVKRPEQQPQAVELAT